MRKLQPLEDDYSKLKAKCCEITLLLRDDFAAFLYSVLKFLLKLPDICRKLEAENLKVEANFAALRG